MAGTTRRDAIRPEPLRIRSIASGVMALLRFGKCRTRLGLLCLVKPLIDGCFVAGNARAMSSCITAGRPFARMMPGAPVCWLVCRSSSLQ